MSNPTTNLLPSESVLCETLNPARHYDLNILDVLLWPECKMVETKRGWTWIGRGDEAKVGEKLWGGNGLTFFPDFWKAVEEWEASRISYAL